MRIRLSLAGQSLVLQLVIVVAVLLSVGAVALAQVNNSFERTEGQRMLDVAETVAATSMVRAGLAEPTRTGVLQSEAEAARMVSGADFVTISAVSGGVVTSPDPAMAGGRLPEAQRQESSARAWVGVSPLNGEDDAVSARVPVVDGTGRLLGHVTAGRDYPGVGERLLTAAPTVLVYLGIASVLGIAGSLLLARRVKRQSLGLEPAEIARLVEHREAMLHGIREGVVGLDADNRVTLVNATAADLLRLPEDSVGRRLEELGVAPAVERVLRSADEAEEGDEAQEGEEQVALMGERLVTLSRMPLVTGSGPSGSVTTMRDRSELVALQRQLDLTRTSTAALRAQAHEFSNRLHVISGLLELGEYAEVSRYVTRISGAQARRNDEMVARVGDSSLAALLIAKATLAAEQGARLTVNPAEGLDELEGALAGDLVTVVGNLVDNALEAVLEVGDPWVEVGFAVTGATVAVTVADSGPGVPADQAELIFQRGFTTKGGSGQAQRGLGLAITQLVCARRGGGVTVDGSVFTARLRRDPEVGG